MFTKYYFCGVFKYIRKGNKLDLEKELNLIGRDIGQRMVLLTHFKRDFELESLLYRIVFTLLPCLYPAERIIEKSKNSTVMFYIYENDAAFDDCTDQSACASSIISGVIEIVLEISGFDFLVSAYKSANEDKRVIYMICEKQKSD